jgi:hypothetical protein
MLKFLSINQFPHMIMQQWDSQSVGDPEVFCHLISYFSQHFSIPFSVVKLPYHISIYVHIHIYIYIHTHTYIATFYTVAQLVEALSYKPKGPALIPDGALGCFNDLILPAALWPRGRHILQQKWVPEIAGAKGWQHYRLGVPTVQKFWETSTSCSLWGLSEKWKDR